ARAYLLRSFRRRPESRSGGAEADGIGAEPLEPASEPFHLDPGLRRDARVARAYLLRSFRRRPESRSRGAERMGSARSLWSPGLSPSIRIPAFAGMLGGFRCLSPGRGRA